MTETEADFEELAKQDLVAGIQHLVRMDDLSIKIPCGVCTKVMSLGSNMIALALTANSSGNINSGVGRCFEHSLPM